ncbi:MAG: HAD hydrolase family protein [Akkermansia muciniphila]|nr:HAD hydrolase family protein [uncultured Akkermansia sp.]
MRVLRAQYGVLWGVNTGRDPVYLREGLADMFRDNAEAFAPDFTVTMERNVHLADAEGRLMPGVMWNDACAVAHDDLFTRYGGVLESLMNQLEGRFSGLGLRRQDNDAFSLVVNDACGLDEVSCVIQNAVGPYKEIVTQRAGPYLRFSHRDYNKGTSLSFVASRFGVSSAHIAIFGDGHNDLDAMRHLPEAFRCCPSNAAQEVKDMVARGHGYISPEPRTRGVLDGLAHGVFPYFGMKAVVPREDI